MKKIILHIDFDSFFASVEQQYNPLLRNKPIGVTATNGRTCIIAASREAKRFGIKTASRTFEAYQKCPQLQLVPADFVKYFEVSKKFLKICSNYSFLVEMFSIDEVFMDITETAHLFGGVGGLIQAFKKQLALEVGEYITVSVGISYNKLLAKLASGLRKPNGMFEIQPDHVWEVYQQAKLTDMCGIGEKIKLRLHTIGIYTLLQLRDAPEGYLVKEFGSVEGHFLHRIGNALDDSPIIPYEMEPDVKSVGRNYCLPHNEYNLRIVLQNIYELCEEVGIKLRRLEKKGKTVGLRIGGCHDMGGRKTIYQYIHTGREIFSVCKDLYDQWYDSCPEAHNRMGRQISVWVENLTNEKSVPLYLFQDQSYKFEKVTKTVDALNDRFGNHTIRNGFLLYADKLTTVPNGYGSDKWDRITLARESQM